MRELLPADQTEKWLEQVQIPELLVTVLDSELFSQDQAVVLSNLKHEYSPKSTKDYDLIAYESFVNHVHIEDYVDRSTTNLLRIGLAYALRLHRKLLQASPDEQFQVVVDYADNSCTVRFVKIRNGDGLIPVSDDLSGFKDEAILVIEP